MNHSAAPEVIRGSDPAAGKKYLVPFIFVISLFFLWGMAHNLDSSLIPHLKKACNLSNTQSMLIDTSVFLAYFLMAIPAGMILKKWGYKASMIAGLLVFAAGAFLFVPAANELSYITFLIALFIIGCGLTLLETTANPYAAVLGDPAKATSRLNLAASFNGLAAMVAGYVGTRFILSGKSYSKAELAAMTEINRNAYFMEEAASVKMPYIILGSVLVLFALIFCFIRFPEIKTKSIDGEAKGSFIGALRHKHLKWAVVAQFFYVGAQVCVTSSFIRAAQQGAGFDEGTAGYYLIVYGFLFTVGRFAGTALLQWISSQKLLSIYAIVCIILCLIAVLGSGVYVVYALGGLGFFMSIMFPTIFALGIDGIGDDTKPGSSWLIMSIVGGAIIPVCMGALIDHYDDQVQIGYYVPLICFLVILYFGLKGYKIAAKS
ncbi:L-fucose:H+ symporter permease [Pedobacter heparinus]|uniref:L-fucose transporter n=1 Tax=Pedobacter heparinus (strain ATCC 13125 / DSM 2366 / CIP 104194 / JCM 7457 / NBRC 12017 / NCIMB 9290 / NRRL B-14731 / HIM 762-3) TaxID=485917 RepID=C6Y124_PEDHD|nr:L-fucose:H+ symporter permease [Pedobacter heparinus]ACU04951.1 L-fucose transporter [Pedobacter heparinus DSM 2366]